MTATVAKHHGQVAVFVAVDHCSAECVGIHAALNGTRHEALEPVRQGVKARFGAIGKDVAAGLSRRHDHGSQYMSDDFQREIRWSGIAPSRPSSGDGRQWLRREVHPDTQENLLRTQTSKTAEDLRQALLAFRKTYNEYWPIERHGPRSPARFRRDQLDSQPMAAEPETSVAGTEGGALAFLPPSGRMLRWPSRSSTCR